MSRLRALAALVVLATTGLLITPTAAMAAGGLRAYITCDAETGAVTTWTSGWLLAVGTPPTRVTVEFQRSGGRRVSATTSASLPPLAQPFTTTATTTTSGDITATGYTGTFNPATSLFYQEKLIVTFKNASTGAFYTTREASCEYDQRTTVSLTCDPNAGTVTATVAGVNAQAGASSGAGRPVRIGYRVARTSQSSKDDPAYRSVTLGPGWDVERQLTRAADGTWTDPGYVHTITRNPYYYAEELTVGILDTYGAVVGWGATRCTLFDGSVTPAA
jgi:hypothetical protein